MEKIKAKIGIVIISIAITAISVVCFDMSQSESRALNFYNSALMNYKKQDYQAAMNQFGKVPTFSGLKSAALFREARCATQLKDNETAKRKYMHIISVHNKSSIAVLSLYNLGVLMFEEQNTNAEKYFKRILKKYPNSQYANPAQYYLARINLSKINDKCSEQKAERLRSEAIQKLYSYIEAEPNSKFTKSALEIILQQNAVKSAFDNLLVAKSYYAMGEYETAKVYMDKTSKEENWNDWAMLAVKLNNTDDAKKLIEEGLNKYSETLENEELYRIIDNYILLQPSKQSAINRLRGLFVAKKIKASDYIMYLDCSTKWGGDKIACFADLYEAYPNGQFAADALANVILSRFFERKFSDVDRFGRIHMKKFPNTKSAPMISYIMGKMSERTKHREAANTYYNYTLNKYPDSYYAYRAYLALNKGLGIEMFDQDDLTEKSIVFPYKKSMENNLVVKLALLGDYDLVEEICKSDAFVQSWIAFKKGHLTKSCILAREAMDKMEVKPDFNDLRWRLVYPLHHWDIVSKHKYTNNPIIIESIIKEESHFNQNAISNVGAKGLMQMMPATEKELIHSYQIKKETDPIVNDIKFGSVYFASLMHTLNNKALFAIAAYNGGIGSVQKWQKSIKFTSVDEFVEQIPYPETNNYVKKILRTYWMYSNIYN